MAPAEANHLNNGNGNGRGPAGLFRRATDYSGKSTQETGLVRTVRILKRRGLLLAGVWILCIAASAGYASTRSTSYRSEASIEVGRDTPTTSSDLIGEMSGRLTPPWEAHFRTQEALLRRPGLLADVLEALPPEAVAEYKKSDDPVRKLSDKVKIEAVPSTFLIRISLDHPTPKHGPEIVNKLLELFIEDSNRRLRELKSGALDMLSQEMLPDVRAKMEEAEKREAAFAVETGIGDFAERYASLLEAQRRITARLFEVRMRGLTLRTQPPPEAGRLEEGAPQLVQDAESLRGGARSLESLAARRAELEVALARQKAVYKDKHQSVVSLTKELEAVNALIESAVKATAGARQRTMDAALARNRLEQEAAAEEERALEGENRRLDATIATTRVQLDRYRKLEFEATAARDLYNSYLKKQVEVKALSGAGIAGVRVVDLVRTPIQNLPKGQLILTIGVVLGLLFGVGAVILVEQNDDRASTPQEAEAAMQLELLAAVPALPRMSGRNDQPLVAEDSADSPSLDFFRRLRSQMAARLQKEAGPKTLAVLSASRGEGTSTVAVNLARAFALEGKRVLLFDADLRRPGLKALLEQNEGLGLEECLLQGVPIKDCIGRSRIPGVDVVGARRAMAGAAEIPGSSRFRIALSEARSRYDYVIVDAGPVHSASEVPEVASQADAAVLVLDEGRSKILQSLAARRILDNHNVKLLGMVVNRTRTPQARTQESRARVERTGSNGNGGTPGGHPTLARHR